MNDIISILRANIKLRRGELAFLSPDFLTLPKSLDDLNKPTFFHQYHTRYGVSLSKKPILIDLISGP